MRRLILALALCLAAAPAVAARIKDISVLRSARDSQLVGYGLVVGLQGSGDTLRNAPFTEQSVQAMLTHLGLDVHGASLRNRNVASVIVTADLSAGVETASRLDVTVSALGDAPSLMGGTLLLTQLQAADGTVYASAQGAVSVTGFDAVGQGETLSQGVPTAGRIPNGAIVEHELPGFAEELRSMLELKNPDYATAVRIVDAINAYSRERFRASAAYEVDSRRVELFRPRRISFARFMAEIGELQVAPGHGRARRSRRADRHGRRRPGRADFDRRGDLRNADGPGRRAASRLAAGAILERQDGRHAQHQDRRRTGGRTRRHSSADRASERWSAA